MLCLGSSPLDHNIVSSAELLNSRVHQVNLPSISKPGLSLSADGEVNTKLQARQDEQKSQYDKSSKLLPAIYPDDPEHVLNPHDHKWQPGIIKGSTQAPRSYMVTMTNGSTLRRTRSHIRPTGENICIQNIPSDEPPAPSYEACSSMPSISRDSCEQTGVQPQKSLSAIPQDLSSPLTDWTYRLNSKKKLFMLLFWLLNLVRGHLLYVIFVFHNIFVSLLFSFFLCVHSSFKKEGDVRSCSCAHAHRNLICATHMLE